MSPIRAVLVTPGAPGSLVIGESQRSEPLPGEALVKGPCHLAQSG